PLSPAGDLAAAAGALAAGAVADGLAAAADATLALQYETLASTPFGLPPAPAARLLGTVANNDADARADAAAGRRFDPSAADAAADVHLSRMRVPLRPPPSSATLLATVAEPAAQLQLAPGPLRFDADGLLLDLPAAPTSLTFLRPLSGAEAPTAVDGDLGAPLLPVVLRELPAPPQPAEQCANATDLVPPSLSQAGRWTFTAVVVVPEAAQDELLVGVELGAPPVPAAHPTLDTEELASTLWRWFSLSGGLREQVGACARGELPGSAIVATVGTLLDPLVAAWEAHWSSAPPDADPAADPRHDLSLRVEWETGPDPLLRAVVLTRADADATTALPEVGWCEPDGSVSALLPDPAGSRAGALAFHPAAPIVRSGPARLQLAWSGLNVAATQRAQVALATRRNARLPNTSPFVTISPRSLAAAVAPALAWPDELRITGESLAAALRDALGQLFGDATGQQLRLQLSYGLPLAESTLRSWLPVALLPAEPLSPALADAIDDTASRWLEATGSPTAGAAWGIGLTLPSAVPGDPPLLTVERLLYELPPA
ncbi:hypothetical protein VSS74_30070, partial [Conexibacter stalactiti]